MSDLRLHCSALDAEGHLPDRFLRTGGNVSPPLQWSGVPLTAAEVILLCEDPDAGRPPFLHWLVTGIAPADGSTPEGTAPGREWRNGYGEIGWGGPRPMAGDRPHRYFFRAYALATPLDLPGGAQAVDVHHRILGQVLASGVLVATAGAPATPARRH